MKFTQSCLILCNAMDCIVHGILQARILEWIAFPSPGDRSNPGIEPKSPTLQADLLPAEPSVQLSHILLFATPWPAARQASLSITKFWSLLKLMSIELAMSSSVVPFSSCLQSFPASGSFLMSQFFTSGGQLQHQSFQ